MAFSKFLDSKRGECKELVAELKKYFVYVSILGSDIRSANISVNKRTSKVGEENDTECGFVVKMTNGGAFFEYSLDDVTGDKKKLAEKILDSIKIDPRFSEKTIVSAEIADNPMIKDFTRENDLADYSEKTILDFCSKINKEILSKDERIVNSSVIVRTLETSKLFVSENKMLTQNYAWINGYVFAIMRDGEKMVSVREGKHSHLMSDVIGGLGGKVDKLVDKGGKLLTAKPIEPGLYDVITDPSITGLIAHEAFGHGVEMDMFVKDRALAKQFVGKYVASPITNMRDGASATLSAASYFFDDDGVLAHDTQIIKDGILLNGISDLISASQLGTEPTGNGRRESHTRKAYSRMTNTFFECGSDKLKDMIASIKHGYMIFETNNGMEDPKNWAIQCVAEYGIEIADGKLTDNYVSPVVMSGYVPDLLKSISMVSDNFEVEGAGFCGKGHKEWVRVSDGGPSLKVKVKLS